MEFTYSAYSELLDKLVENNYAFTNYHSYKHFEKCVILRHDVDYDLQKTIRIAEIEHEKGISSTYFLLLTSDFYNLMSKESEQTLKKLQSLGHDIGLHFDEERYDLPENWNKERVSILIKKEADMLASIIGRQVRSVSMHRPSKMTLEGDLRIANIENSYSQEFFKNFMYISDSRMNWRENPEEIISSGQYNRIQLLTHAFWYFDRPREMRDIVEDFIYARGEVSKHRYRALRNNITDLEKIVE